MTTAPSEFRTGDRVRVSYEGTIDRDGDLCYEATDGGGFYLTREELIRGTIEHHVRPALAWRDVPYGAAFRLLLSDDLPSAPFVRTYLGAFATVTQVERDEAWLDHEVANGATVELLRYEVAE